MKKSAIPVVFMLIAGGLSGCPIYDDDTEGCFDDLDCGSGYLCDDRTGSCFAEPTAVSCRRPADCDTNETCSRDATCVPGDCHFASVGCVDGYECSKQHDRWECVAEGAGQGGTDAGGGAPSTGAAGEPSVPQGGSPTTPNAGAPSDAGAAPSGGGAGGAG